MIWFLAAPLVSKAVQRIATLIAALVCVFLMGFPMLGILLNPLAPWWLSGQGAVAIGAPVVTVPVTVPAGPAPGPQTIVSDVQRYLLAIGAGFAPSEAITAVAISIAENGSGNPSAVSGLNFNNTVDTGLWQVNTIWESRFGGHVALMNPVTNAMAARYVFVQQGWCAWSTYERSCGLGHNSAYAAFMGRARAAAEGVN